MRYEEIIPITNVLMFKKRMWIKEYAFRMENWFKEEKTGPLRIDAEPTRRCNSNCIFCARRNSPVNLTEESKKLELSKQRWVELAKESAELGTRAWNISGIGEPMCRPDTTLSLMKMIKAYEMFGELTTNGTLWKDKHIKSTIKMGWDSICISIDAPDAETHDFLRGTKGAFKKATKTVKRFKYWQDKLHPPAPSISINMVLNKKNYNKLPEMMKFAHQLGVDAIFVEPMIVFSDDALSLKLGKEEISQLPNYIQEARDLGERYNILPTISCVGIEREFDEELVKKTSNVRELLIEDVKKCSDKILSIPCYYPWFFLMVRVDGSVLPCGECDIIKDSLKNKSLQEVWFGDRFNRVRQKFLAGDLPKECEKCRPNVINDTRQIRKAITRYRDVEQLQKEMLELLSENQKLRKEVYVLRKKVGRFKNVKCLDSFCEHERELLKWKNSLTYKVASKLGNTKLGKKIKKMFGVYV